MKNVKTFENFEKKCKYCGLPLNDKHTKTKCEIEQYRQQIKNRPTKAERQEKRKFNKEIDKYNL